MKKHFYSHIVETSTLSLALGEVALSHEERINLISLVDSNIYHAVLDAVLSELSEEDKKLFLSHLALEKHDEIWKLLNSKVENIEEKIRQVADLVKKELHSDIENPFKMIRCYFGLFVI